MRTLNLFIVGFCLSCCEKHSIGEYPLYVKNNSAHSITFLFNDDINHSAIYPDTSLSSIEDGIIEIPSGERVAVAGSRNWESVFEAKAPGDTISIVILHKDTLSRYSWTDIQDSYNILKRYDLGLRDLERLGFTITYPPDSSMVGVKMWPVE